MNDYDTFKLYIKLLDWVANLPESEKKQEKKWKPRLGKIYFTPSFSIEELYTSYGWDDGTFDNWNYKRGLCCKTAAEAIALGERMLEAIKN